MKPFEPLRPRAQCSNCGDDLPPAPCPRCFPRPTEAEQQGANAIALLALLAETPPIQRWKEYEERGEQRIPCFIQVETAQAIAEFFPAAPSRS